MGDVEDMVYDSAIYEVTVRVFEKDGKLESEISYKRNGEEYNDTPAFVNRTKEDPEIPETSDGNTYIYVIIAVVSVVAVAAVYPGSKKRKN